MKAYCANIFGIFMVFFVMVTMLSGCVSAEESSRRQEAYEIGECTKLGFKKNTEAFANCRLQLRVSQNNYYYSSRPYNCTQTGNMLSCY